MEVITVCNIKGGTGKTTTIENIARVLAIKGYKVLAIDTDGQCNMTYDMKADLQKEEHKGKDLYNLLQCVINNKPYNVQDYIQTSDKWELDIIPATEELHEINNSKDRIQSEFKNWKQLIAIILEEVKTKYDYCLIDTNLNPGILTKCVLYSADKVIIPMMPVMRHYQGLANVFKLIEEIKADNSKLQIAGILFLDTSLRTNGHKLVYVNTLQYAEAKEAPVFETIIHTCVDAETYCMTRESLIDYAPKSKPALDYIALTNELLGE